MMIIWFLSNFSIVDADNRIIDRCRGWCSMAGIPYYRFSPYMATDIELDEKEESGESRLLNAGDPSDSDPGYEVAQISME